MPHLLIRQTGYIQHSAPVSAQQIVCRYAEKISHFHQHFNGRQNIVILPIGHTLFGNSKPFGKFNLAQSPCRAELFNIFVQSVYHIHFSVAVNNYNTIIK